MLWAVSAKQPVLFKQNGTFECKEFQYALQNQSFEYYLKD